MSRIKSLKKILLEKNSSMKKCIGSRSCKSSPLSLFQSFIIFFFFHPRETKELIKMENRGQSSEIEIKCEIMKIEWDYKKLNETH